MATNIVSLNPLDATPVDYPTITIAGRVLTVRFNFFAQYKLSEWGISLQEFREVLATIKPGETPDPRFVAKIVQVFAACVSSSYAEAGLAVPTPEYWAMHMEDRFGEVCRAVTAALGKAPRPDQTPAPATAPLTN